MVFKSKPNGTSARLLLHQDWEHPGLGRDHLRYDVRIPAHAEGMA